MLTSCVLLLFLSLSASQASTSQVLLGTAHPKPQPSRVRYYGLSTWELNPRIRSEATRDSPLHYEGNMMSSKAARVPQSSSWHSGPVCLVIRDQAGRQVAAVEMVCLVLAECLMAPRP